MGFEEEGLSQIILEVATTEDKIGQFELFSWGEYWIIPVFSEAEPDDLLGLVGVEIPGEEFHRDQKEAFQILIQRAYQALEDRNSQQQIFTSIEDLTPQMNRIQSLRAASRFD